MFKKISVLVPTRMRVKILREMVRSYNRTSDPDSSELVFRIDDDDEETRQYLAGHPRTLIGPRLQGYRSLPTFFNEMLALATGDVLMCGNDDMLFRTEGWAPKLLSVANQYPDGLFDLGVKTHNEVNFPFACVSRKVVDALGFIFDPTIFWGDIYLRDIMVHFGRAVMVPEVQINHDWMGHLPDPVFLDGEQVRRANWMQFHEEAVRRAVSVLGGVAA